MFSAPAEWEWLRTHLNITTLSNLLTIAVPVYACSCTHRPIHSFAVLQKNLQQCLLSLKKSRSLAHVVIEKHNMRITLTEVSQKMQLHMCTLYAEVHILAFY